MKIFYPTHFNELCRPTLVIGCCKVDYLSAIQKVGLQVQEAEESIQQSTYEVHKTHAHNDTSFLVRQYSDSGLSKFFCACVCRGMKNPFILLSLSLPPCYLSLRVVRLQWSPPGRPSGIMLGYEVLRRTLRSCGSGSSGVTATNEKESEIQGVVRFKCTYLQCTASHRVCGTSCFQPDIQVIT